MFPILLIALFALIFSNRSFSQAIKQHGGGVRSVSNRSSPGPTMNLYSTSTSGRPMDILQHVEYVVELQRAAQESRRLTENKYPDKGEAGITALERLYRIALYAIKDPPAFEDYCFSQKWDKWWRAIQSPPAFDGRTVADRFYAYATERQAGIIPETDEIARFEKQLNDYYMEYLHLHTYVSLTSSFLREGVDHCDAIP